VKREAPFFISEYSFAIKEAPFSISMYFFAIKEAPFSISEYSFAIKEAPFSISEYSFAIKEAPFFISEYSFAIKEAPFSISEYSFAIKEAPMEKVSEKLRLLSPEEAAVIEALRTQRLKSVTIRLNDGGEVDFLELTTVEHADRGTKLLELMVHEGYHEIRVKTEKGKVVYCENIRKIKLK
jgi:hypothetical protein